MNLIKIKKRTIISICIYACLLLAFDLTFTTVFGFGDSMSPTMNSGALLFANRTDRTISLGDIVSVRVPDRKDIIAVKRVIAVPGDKVEVNGIRLWINDEEVDFGEWPSSFNVFAHNVYHLEEDEYFVVGDNFAKSRDSRAFGPVSIKNILDVVKFWINF